MIELSRSVYPLEIQTPDTCLPREGAMDDQLRERAYLLLFDGSKTLTQYMSQICDKILDNAGTTL